MTSNELPCEPPLSNQDGDGCRCCAVCGAALKVVTTPRATPSGRLGVRCTNCPAGGDILPDGSEHGPALTGATSAQAYALTQHTNPSPSADTGPDVRARPRGDGNE